MQECGCEGMMTISYLSASSRNVTTIRNLPRAGSHGRIQCMCESMASSTFEVYCLICSRGASGLERLRIRHTSGGSYSASPAITVVNTCITPSTAGHCLAAVLTLLEHQERRAHCLSADGTAHTQPGHPHHSSIGRCFSGDAAGHCLQADSSVAGW